MSEEVYEWFARAGYHAVLATMQKAGMVDGGPDQPPRIRLSCDDDTEQITVEVNGEDRRVVYDDDFGWLWYNAAGPEAA